MTFIKKTFQKLIYLCGGLVAGFALLIMFAAWQFSYGPIPLGFLAPYIEAAVNHGVRDISIRMGEPILTWAGWDRALDIRILDLELVDQAGIKMGSIPEVAFSMSGDALLQGKLAPKSIDLFGPSLHFRRDRDGGIDVGFGTQSLTSEDVAFSLMGAILEKGPENNALSYLTRVAIVDADITIIDQVLNKSWHLPAADMRIERFIDRLNGRLSLVLDEDQQQTVFDIRAEYLIHSGKIRADVEFNKASPAMFGDIAGVAPLKHLEMPLNGTISLSMPIDGKIDHVEMALNGEAGKLHLPKPFSQTLEVTEIVMSANYDGKKRVGLLINSLSN